MKKNIKGWGRYNSCDSNISFPENTTELKNSINKDLITRGSGRSYGDSSLYSNVIKTTKFNKIINFDTDKGIIKCQSGLKFNQILDTIVPQGWFFFSTPGTSEITIGGAIASDIHGKNHHNSGTFCDHIISIEILMGNGEITEISKTNNETLYYATCGGMGLTGIIISATFKLKKINSTKILQKTVKTKNIEETIQTLIKYNNYTYSVAWLDLSTIKNNGRGLVMLGEHNDDGDLKFKKKLKINFPCNILSFFLNNFTIKLFNNFYFLKEKNSLKVVDLEQYFYPLDKIKNWNLLYGKQGFIQYQFLLPEENIIENIKILINKFYELNLISYLSVLKKMGKKNKNFLSFPDKGFALALDIKNKPGLKKSINILDTFLVNMGGRVYLTKDSLMNEENFKKSYPNWNKFQIIRDKYKAKIFKSNQSLRIGL